MNKDKHYTLTRIFIPFLVTIFFVGFLAPICGAVPAQGGRITGKVVADIPDQRKALAGVIVTLSGERLGDKRLQSVSDM